MRSNPFISLFAASLIALLPAHAFAQQPPADQPAPTVNPAPSPSTPTTPIQPQQATNPDNVVGVRDRPRPEVDPRGVRLGGFTLNGSLGVEVTSTDNLFAAETNEQDDIIYTIAPEARLASNWSRHALSIEAGGASRMHDEWSSEDVDTYYARAAGRLDITNDTELTASAGTSHEFTPRTDPDLTAVGAPVEYDRNDFMAGVAQRFGRFTARLDASQTERRYDGVESYRDYDQTSLRGRADIEVSPRIGVLVEGTFDERDYDNDTLTPLDSEGQTYLVGATIRGDVLQGEVSVGHFERDFDNPAIGNVDGLAVAAELEWYITQLTTISLDARRASEDNATTGTVDPYVVTEYGARVDHELLRNLVVSAGARAGDRDYENIARKDKFVTYEVGADYWMNRRIAIRGRYRHDDVDSDGANRDFDVNAVTLGLSLRL